MSKPAVIMITSNGVGAGHLIRASAIARELHPHTRPIIFSMAYSVVEVANALNLECEYVPGRDKGLMPRKKWDKYLRDRLIALIDETNATVVTFDGVVPYPGIVAAKLARSHVNLIWIRRGMWQRKPQGVLLGLQSRLMDYVIEPGDIAHAADLGPTKDRSEALVVDPVSLYRPDKALSRKEARSFLELPLDKPAVLVQMGVGSTDLDARASAVLRGLAHWKDVQIVMPRKPVDVNGESLVPEGMSVKVIRHFPLADLLPAFDAAVCAAGYNSVHELIPAAIPTLFIANNRGTDDQEARARWCAEAGLALYSRNDSLHEIEQQAAKLSFATLRENLTKQCHQVGASSGAKQIAELIFPLTNPSLSALVNKRIYFQRFLAFGAYLRGPGFYIKRTLNSLLRALAIGFRTLFPHVSENSDAEVVFSDSRNHQLLDRYIRKAERFEHILENTSHRYISKRQKIARIAYGDFEIQPLSERTEIETLLKFAS